MERPRAARRWVRTRTWNLSWALPSTMLFGSRSAPWRPRPVGRLSRWMPLLRRQTRAARRFWSRFLEPTAEAADALSVLDWAQSTCPTCGVCHREVVYAFPPAALVRATVEKACADRALCVLVVPVSILAPFWSKLLAASVLPLGQPYRDGFVRIRSPGAHLRHAGSFAPVELAIFACDFGRLSPRLGLLQLTACPGAFAARQRPPCGGAADLRDRLLLRETLLARREERWTGFAPGGSGLGPAD
jgi:hypothetical protein